MMVRFVNRARRVSYLDLPYNQVINAKNWVVAESHGFESDLSGHGPPIDFHYAERVFQKTMLIYQYDFIGPLPSEAIPIRQGNLVICFIEEPQIPATGHCVHR